MFSLSIFILSLQALNLLSYSLISSRISDIFSISLTNISRVFSSSMPYFCIAFSSFSSCFFIRSFSVLAKGSFSFITALALSMTLTHSLKFCSAISKLFCISSILFSKSSSTFSASDLFLQLIIFSSAVILFSSPFITVFKSLILAVISSIFSSV